MAFRTCSHIKSDGIACQSPAMREKKFCHYHTLYRRRIHPTAETPGSLKIPMVDAQGHYRNVDIREPFAQRYKLGALEDGPSLQVAISTVINALADNRLDIGRASTLLYGLQLASTNLRNFQPVVAPDPMAAPLSVLESGSCAQVPSTEELGPEPAI